MEYLAGAVRALAVCMAATPIGFDRDRTIYPVVLIIIASCYGLVAIMSGFRLRPTVIRVTAATDCRNRRVRARRE